MAPVVLNIRDLPYRALSQGAVFIGRPSKWGNSYIVGRDGTREQVIERYRSWLHRQIETGRLNLGELEGRDLVCFCAPLPCHGDVLLEFLGREVRA